MEVPFEPALQASLISSLAIANALPLAWCTTPWRPMWANSPIRPASGLSQ